MLPNSWGPATVLTVALTVVVSVVGAIIAIWHPSELSFTTYAQLLLGSAGANAVLAIGRGLFNVPTTPIKATALPAPSDAATSPGVVVQRAPAA